MKHARYYLAAALAVAVAFTAGMWMPEADPRPEAKTPGLGGTATPKAQLREQPSFPGYDLSHPTSSFALPAELTEISALTDIDDHTVACVQDEVGAVFFIDLRSGAVTRRLPFGPDGDYEGLTRVADTLWVLRSDGLLIELALQGDALAPGRQVHLDLEHHDIEGLGYDPVHDLILVAPKSSPKGTKTERAQRRVFKFDPASGKRLEGLALDTTSDRVMSDAATAGISLPMRSTKRGQEKVDLKVRFASIAVHPRTDRLHALSAVDGALLAFTRDGTLCAAHFFDALEMPKPEGITFLANGDMVIASEGVDAPSRLQVFRYQDGSPPRGR